MAQFALRAAQQVVDICTARKFVCGEPQIFNHSCCAGIEISTSDRQRMAATLSQSIIFHNGCYRHITNPDMQRVLRLAFARQAAEFRKPG